MSYRYIYAGLGALAIAVISLAVVFTPRGRSVELPGPVEQVFPHPNDSVLRQTTLEIDLQTGYRAEIWVDGFRIPDSEIRYVEATGVQTWSPSPTGLYLTEWAPGEHQVRIRWDTVRGLPDVGEFTWSFRVQ